MDPQEDPTRGSKVAAVGDPETCVSLLVQADRERAIAAIAEEAIPPQASGGEQVADFPQPAPCSALHLEAGLCGQGASGPAPGWTGPPPAYSETVPDSGAPVNVNVVHIVTPVLYGDQPVQTVCPHCNTQVIILQMPEEGSQ